MSVAARVFRGYGNGTVAGTVDGRVHRGYVAGEAANLVAGYTLYAIRESRTFNAQPERRTLFSVREDRTLEADDA